MGTKSEIEREHLCKTLLPPGKVAPIAIAMWLIVGGSWGIVSAIWQYSTLTVSSEPHISVHIPFWFLMLVVPFALAVAAGVSLCRPSRFSAWAAASLLIAQALSLQIGGFGYLFSTGAGMFAGIGDGDLIVVSRLGSRFELGALAESGGWQLLVNLVPLFWLAVLTPTLRWYRQTARRGAGQQAIAPAGPAAGAS